MAPVAPLSLLSLPLSLIGLVCTIIILIHAFQNAVWKGLLCLLTGGIFLLYYAFVEFQHEKKALILAGWLLPTILSVALLFGISFMG
jgi:hypothetical protein